MRRSSIALALAGLQVLVACAGTGQDAAPSRQTPTRPTSPEATPLAFDRPETVARGLRIPWGLAFVDQRTMLVTERAGRVRVIRDGSVRAEPAATIPVRHEGEAGLLGIALHPSFDEQPFAYLFYTTSSGNRVSRFPVGDDLRFGQEEIILDGIPASRFHDGGRIAFGPDGMLYVTTGDAQQPAHAADRGSLAGKILRLTPDGDPPEDNPFADSPVYAFGFRNPQGLDWDQEGVLYASDHGPTGDFDLCCHDEVNRIEPGEFYGWPFFAGSTRAMQGNPPQQQREPIRESGADATWAPAGLVARAGDVLISNLRGEQLIRVAPEGGDVATVLDGEGRLRAAVMGPDDCLYLTTSNRDGRGEPRDGDDRVLRLCPR